MQISGPHIWGKALESAFFNKHPGDTDSHHLGSCQRFFLNKGMTHSDLYFRNMLLNNHEEGNLLLQNEHVTWVCIRTIWGTCKTAGFSHLNHTYCP